MSKSLLVSIEKQFPVTVFHFGFWRGELPTQMNGLFKSDDVHGNAGGERFQSNDTEIPFICRLADRATGYMEDLELTKVNYLYFELLIGKDGRSWRVRWKVYEWMVLLRTLGEN